MGRGRLLAPNYAPRRNGNRKKRITTIKNITVLTS
nr:MAG TPA: hypothetical protein [Bacteriophage sp.]